MGAASPPKPPAGEEASPDPCAMGSILAVGHCYALVDLLPRWEFCKMGRGGCVRWEGGKGEVVLIQSKSDKYNNVV